MKDDKNSPTRDCFVIMPISDSSGYDSGHFLRVYEDIFKPACVGAGFNPVRADDVKQTNLIHLDILQRIIESPVAICDLSSRNPNVLFELGLRQAFDKPTVLVREVGTPDIFDIAPLRYTQYRKELKYREVIEDQEAIKEAISATVESAERGDGVNSIIRILSLAGSAKIEKVDNSDNSALLQLVRAEMSELRSDVRNVVRSIRHPESSMRPIDPEHRAFSKMSHAREIIKSVEAKFPEIGRGAALEALTQARAILDGLADLPVSSAMNSEIIGLTDMCSGLEKRLWNKFPPENDSKRLVK